MIAGTVRGRSLYVYHLHMGGADAAALEWQALRAPRFAQRLDQAGVKWVNSTAEADTVVATGLLTVRNLEAVLAELAGMPSPSVLIAAGDTALNGGIWSRLRMPGVLRHTLSYYADVQISVPGSPPTPQALLAAIAAAAVLLG